MTPEQLKEIRERAEKATPGPWIYNFCRVLTSDREFIADFGTASTWQDCDDAAFTAHARQDIPALLAHIEQLEQRAAESNRNLEFTRKGFSDKCPFTGLEFFMEIEHPDYGLLPTYGGPFDSYTIPRRCDDSGDQQFERLRYDHDEGCWKEWEGVPLQVIEDEKLWALEERAERAEKAAAEMRDALEQWHFWCTNDPTDLRMGKAIDRTVAALTDIPGQTYLSPAEVGEVMAPLLAFIEDCELNWDCDTDTGGEHTDSCRACRAKKLIMEAGKQIGKK